MRCPYCHAKISNKVLFCSSCRGQIKKRKGRVPLSILTFFVVFLAIHICVSSIWEVDNAHILQAPDWYPLSLLGISILAAALTYRFLGPKKVSANTISLSDSTKASKVSPPNYLRGNASSDLTNPPANRFENPIESFTPTFPIIPSDGEIPELQGDYAKAVFLWAVSSSGTVKDDNEYSLYITYECGIRHPQSYHEEMINQGYLEEDSVEKSFMYFKVPELKALATQLRISSSGKKADLVTRIISSADQEFIANHRPFTFSLSDKGKEFLTEHDAYIQLHRHKVWGINWKEYDLHHKSGESFQETIASILYNRAAKDTHLMGRQEYFSLYQLMEENGKKKEAILFLLQTLYIDVSGISGIETYNCYKTGVYTKSDLENCFASNVMIAPVIINSIARYTEYYSDSIVEKLYSWTLPVQICPKSLFLKIVHAALAGSFDFNMFTLKLQTAYKRFIDAL